MNERLEGVKILTASEMIRIEQESLERGARSEVYMLKAGAEIAKRVEAFVEKHKLAKEITLLAGKGNNGADGYVTVLSLLEKGFNVKAFYVYDIKESSPLNKKYHLLLQSKGISCIQLTASADFQPLIGGVILDALLGTGCHGELEPCLQEAIAAANFSSMPILSIDIPSGLQGDSGEVLGAVIQADKTFYLGAPKAGFFLREGFDCIGELEEIDFGMEKKYIERAVAFGFLLNEKYALSLLPPIKRTQHKYQRGYVLTVAGSKEMPGAAYLTCYGAYRAGAGIVRLFHPEEAKESLGFCFPELIKTSLEKKESLAAELQRAGSLVIGPGLSQEPSFQNTLAQIFKNITLPCVVDAGALYLFSHHIKSYPDQVILTPHRQEMMRCLEIEKIEEEEHFLELCQDYVEKRGVTLILKGAPTFIFHPKKAVLVSMQGDPGMATAGSGDVLSGILGALLAKGLPSREAAALGVHLHGLAGKKAAKKKSSYTLMASDLLEELPLLFTHLEEIKAFPSS